MVFRGTVTTLRPITLDDAGITLQWRLGSRARHLQRGARTIGEQTSWIAAKLDTDELNFIIEYKNVPVGMVALLDINHVHRTVQMGRLLIGEEALVGNAPVAFESDLMLSDHAFDTLKMHKIWGDVLEENQGMLRTRFYLGYKQDGVLREHYLFDGVYKNTVAVSILEDEYRTICRPKLVQLIDLFSRVSGPSS